MSNRAMTWAIDCGGIPLATKAILMLLADCHNGASGKCCPSEEWIAEKADIKDRTVRMHLKILEDAKLVKRMYKHGGRGVGRTFDGYELKFNLDKPLEQASNGNDLPGQDNAVAGSCHGRIMSLPRQDTAKPIIRKEPEENRKPLCGKSAFERIWPAWSAIGRKRSDSKAKLTDRLNRLAKTFDLEDVVSGCLRFAAATDEKYYPGLQVFLSTGKWENWAGEEEEAAPATREPTRQEWLDWLEHLDAFGEWLPDNVPHPSDPACPIPDDLRPGGQADLLGDAA